jgi:hypothetical protein
MARKPSKVLTAVQAKKKDQIVENKEKMKGLRDDLKDLKAQARQSMKIAKDDEKAALKVSKEIEKLKAQTERLATEIDG